MRQAWAVGEAAPHRVDVLFDSSTCSLLPLEETEISAATTANAAAPANATVPGVTGESGLNACVRRIVAAGGCAQHTDAGRFAYDDASGACGCCASDQVASLPDGEYSGAIYGLGPKPPNTGAPTHCVSGSTLFYPATADGGGGHADATHACACGACSTCGGSSTRWLDWSGPFVVGDQMAREAFVDEAKTAPLYDPVDTCLCDYASAEVCLGRAAAAAGRGAGWGGVVAATALVLAARRW